MKHVKSVVISDKLLEYFTTDSDNETGEYGILARYDNKVEIVEAISEDYNFVYSLALSLADSETMPEFIQELCEEALFEASFIEFVEEEK